MRIRHAGTRQREPRPTIIGERGQFKQERGIASFPLLPQQMQSSRPAFLNVRTCAHSLLDTQFFAAFWASEDGI